MCTHINGVCYGKVCTQKKPKKKISLVDKKWKRICWVVLFLMFAAGGVDETYACFRGRRGVFRRVVARIRFRRHTSYNVVQYKQYKSKSKARVNVQPKVKSEPIKVLPPELHDEEEKYQAEEASYKEPLENSETRDFFRLPTWSNEDLPPEKFVEESKVQNEEVNFIFSPTSIIHSHVFE